MPRLFDAMLQRRAEGTIPGHFDRTGAVERKYLQEFESYVTKLFSEDRRRPQLTQSGPSESGSLVPTYDELVISHEKVDELKFQSGKFKSPLRTDVKRPFQPEPLEPSKIQVAGDDYALLLFESAYALCYPDAPPDKIQSEAQKSLQHEKEHAIRAGEYGYENSPQNTDRVLYTIQFAKNGAGYLPIFEIILREHPDGTMKYLKSASIPVSRPVADTADSYTKEMFAIYNILRVADIALAPSEPSHADIAVARILFNELEDPKLLGHILTDSFYESFFKKDTVMDTRYLGYKVVFGILRWAALNYGRYPDAARACILAFKAAGGDKVSVPREDGHLPLSGNSGAIPVITHSQDIPLVFDAITKVDDPYIRRLLGGIVVNTMIETLDLYNREIYRAGWGATSLLRPVMTLEKRFELELQFQDRTYRILRQKDHLADTYLKLRERFESMLDDDLLQGGLPKVWEQTIKDIGTISTKLFEEIHGAIAKEVQSLSSQSAKNQTPA